MPNLLLKASTVNNTRREIGASSPSLSASEESYRRLEEMVRSTWQAVADRRVQMALPGCPPGDSQEGAARSSSTVTQDSSLRGPPSILLSGHRGYNDIWRHGRRWMTAYGEPLERRSCVG